MARRVTTFLHPSLDPAAASRTWPRAAIFDCDGLLADTQACWHEAYRHSAREAGTSLNGFELATLEGASVESAAAHLTAALGTTISPGAIEEALNNALTTSSVGAMPGARRLVSSLLAADLPIAVATNAPLASARLALKRAGLAEFFATVVSAATTGVFKPKPDVYVLACRALRVDPSDAIALEDSAPGVRAAGRAGLTVIAVPASQTVRALADLAVPRLDDARVFELFGVESVTYRIPRAAPRAAVADSREDIRP
jgi:HAD superfamily hydrolase (TIGR01509 family)